MRELKSSQPDRRTFFKQATALIVTSTAFVTNQTILQADETKEAVTEKPNLPPNPLAKRPDPALQLKSIGLGELKIDRDRAAKEFDELIKLIPEEERIRIPQFTGKNAYPDLEKRVKQLVRELDYFQDNGDQFETEMAKPIPWEDEKLFAEVKKFIAKNVQVMSEIMTLIKESDFCSEETSTKLGYVRISDLSNDIHTSRILSYHFRYECRYHVRMEDWSAAYETLLTTRRYFKLIEPSIMSLVQSLVYRGVWLFFLPAIVDTCRHPRIPDQWLSKFLAFAKEPLPIKELLIHGIRCEAQRWFISLVAGIPICKDISDQYLAMQCLALTSSGLPINENNEFYVLISDRNKELKKNEITYSKVVQEKLAGSKNSFDKVATVKEEWQIIKSLTDQLTKSQNPYLDKIVWNPSQQYQDILAVRSAGFFGLLGGFSDSDESVVDEKSKNEIWKRIQKMDNPLGKLLILSMSEIYQKNASFRPNSQETNSSLQLRIALKLYQRENGKRPAKLDELVAEKLIEQIPVNPYSGQQWQYSAERGVIWRTGKDGTEDGRIPDKAPEDLQYLTGEVEKEEYIGIYRLFPN